MATPTAQDIVRPWQPGAFSNGMRAGLAFRQQREGQKQREEIRQQSDATKKAFALSLEALNQNDKIPLASAAAIGMKEFPDAVPQVLMNALEQAAPQLTPYQKQSLEDNRVYREDVLKERREDNERMDRQTQAESAGEADADDSYRRYQGDLEDVMIAYPDLSQREATAEAKRISTLPLKHLERIDRLGSTSYPGKTGTQAEDDAKKPLTQTDIRQLMALKQRYLADLRGAGLPADKEMITQEIKKIDAMLAGEGGTAAGPTTEPDLEELLLQDLLKRRK